MNTLPLDGLRILILEDEFLIAMDLEQVCRDHGAIETRISRSLADLEPGSAGPFDFDAAIVDMRLGGTSTLDFARTLLEAGVPFVFATGYAHPGETIPAFPGVPVVTKPYAGTEIVASLADVVRAQAFCIRQTS